MLVAIVIYCAYSVQPKIRINFHSQEQISSSVIPFGEYIGHQIRITEDNDKGMLDKIVTNHILYTNVKLYSKGTKTYFLL